MHCSSSLALSGDEDLLDLMMKSHLVEWMRNEAEVDANMMQRSKALLAWDLQNNSRMQE